MVIAGLNERHLHLLPTATGKPLRHDSGEVKP